MTFCRVSCIALVALAACSDTDGAQAPATVQFSLDAPLCGTAIPVQFLVDSQVVGADTFRVNLAPSHTLSRAFSVTAGRHLLGAEVMNLGVAHPWPDTPDTAVTLTPGATFTRVLPFYCS